eukprot:gene20112-biopygen2548
MAISRACPPVLRGRTKNVDASVPNSTVVSHDDGIPCGTGPTSLDTVSKVHATGSEAPTQFCHSSTVQSPICTPKGYTA